MSQASRFLSFAFVASDLLIEIDPQRRIAFAAGAAAGPGDVANTYVWKPPFVPADIETLLKSALSQHCGADDYPGDVVASPNWPGAAPGVKGPINALAPIYQKDPLAFTRALLTAGDKSAVLAFSGKDIVARPATFPRRISRSPTNWIGAAGTIPADVLAEAVSEATRQMLAAYLADFTAFVASQPRA